MEFEELKKHEGEHLEIAGHMFTLGFEYDLSGEWAVWNSDKYIIFATLNYEVHGVPIDVRLAEDPIGVIDGTGWEGDVKDFDHYKKIVKVLAESIIGPYELFLG